MGIAWKILLGILGTAVGVILLFVLVILVSSLFISKKKEYKTKSIFCEKLMNFVTGLLVKVFRVKLETTGMELLPEQGQRFLYASNHRSNFDPVFTRFVFRKHDLAFISKPANFKIPIVGKFIHRCGFLEIDRENPRNSMKTLLKAIEYLKADKGSMGVYPEGTRQKEGEEMLPFHDGVFKIALKANVPVVVSAVAGTEKVSKNFPWKRTVVHIDVVGVIYPKEGETSHDIAEQAREMIDKRLKELSFKN